MSKRDFNLTLFQDNMQECQQSARLAVPGQDDVLFFCLERQPNLEAGDIFSVKVIIDDKSTAKFDAVLLDILPPLLQPPSEDRFATHAKILRKYIIQTVIDQVEKDYFNGRAQKQTWTLYFRKIK